MIQTDASINPVTQAAHSERNGEVVGVNPAIPGQGQRNIGIGFAVPINSVKNCSQLRWAGCARPQGSRSEMDRLRR